MTSLPHALPPRNTLYILINQMRQAGLAMEDHVSDELPIYNQLMFAGSDPADRTVTLALGTGAPQGIRIDMKLGLIGPVLAALSAEAYKLNEFLTEEERLQTSTLNANTVFLSEVEGKPAIVFELVGGSMLPLVIHNAEDLAAFAAELTLLVARPTGKAN